MGNLAHIRNNMGKEKLILNIELENGKYTVQFDETGKFWALRNGESWRDLTGDKLVLAMAHEIERLRKKLDDAEFNLAHTGW